MSKSSLFVGVAMLLATTSCSFHNGLSVNGNDIAETAKKYKGNTQWAERAIKTIYGGEDEEGRRIKGAVVFKSGIAKCNLFVHDVLKETGATAPVFKTVPGKKFPIVIDGRNTINLYPLNAAGWGSTGAIIPNWKYMGKASEVTWKKGDVIAVVNHSGAYSGHCGIATGASEVLSAGDYSISTNSYDYLLNGSIRRYTGS